MATAYVKNGSVLIAMASWANETVHINLNIDWDKLGWKADETMFAPAIENYQPQKDFNINDSIHGA